MTTSPPGSLTCSLPVPAQMISLCFKPQQRQSCFHLSLILCAVNHILQLLAWASCDTSQHSQILAALHWLPVSTPAARNHLTKHLHSRYAPEVFPEYLLSYFMVGEKLVSQRQLVLIIIIASHHKSYLVCLWTSVAVTAPALTPLDIHMHHQ